MNISNLSLASIPIELFFDDTKLGTATGFLLKKNQEWCLVTAWHNLTGKHRWTLKNLRSDAGIPNKVKCNAFFTTKNDDGDQFIQEGFLTWVELLYEEEQPRWFVHSDSKLGCDVAVLPLKLPQLNDNKHHLIIHSPLENDFSNMAFDIGGNLFIIGFPFGVEPFPIWKRATVASEPLMIDKSTIPFLSVDTATRQGLSGSPVYSYEASNYKTEDGSYGFGPGPHHRFLGIYTGRRPISTGDDAQIGIVWSRKCIEEILVSGNLDAPVHKLRPIEFPKYAFASPKPSELESLGE